MITPTLKRKPAVRLEAEVLSPDVSALRRNVESER